MGIPTSLSSDLDLTVYVTDINGYQPQFLLDEFVVEFTGLLFFPSKPNLTYLFVVENQSPGAESKTLPNTIDRDELSYETAPAPICYFIVGGNENGLFSLHPLDHTLSVSKQLANIFL